MRDISDLAGEPWQRLLAAARRRLENNGGSLDSAISLATPTEEERRIIIGITGAHRSARAARVRVPLDDLDAYLRSAAGANLLTVLERLDGKPLADRQAQRARERQAREAALTALGAARHAGTPWYDGWVDEIAADGTLTRLIRHDPGQIDAVRTVLDALPATEVPLPVLAEQTTGDTKALGDTRLASLVLRALARWYDLPAETAEERRTLWDASGVIVDDLASQVLVLNLPASGGVLGELLTSAARAGMPLRVTLYQLRRWPVTIAVDELFVCENPAVLRAAAATHGVRAAPLVCTEGVPSVACARLMQAAVDGGARVRWRNDFDWPGLRMTANALERFAAVPWRMGSPDYLAARAVGSGAPLRGTPVPTPWDPVLADTIRAEGQAIMEERLLSILLSDLSLAGHSELTR